MKAVFGKKVFTGDGRLLEEVFLVFEKEFVEISKSKPSCEVFGSYDYITPAFIDAHSHIGLDRFGEPYTEGDVNEEMDSVNFGLDVRDAVIMEDKCFQDAVDHGVLYSCILPGSGNVVGGKGAVVRNFKRIIKDAYIKEGGIKCALGYNPKSTEEWKGTRPSTRGGVFYLLRKALFEAKNAKALIEKDKKEIEELELSEKVALEILEGKHHLRIHVHKGDDVLNGIRLIKEFGIKAVFDHLCDVHRKEVFEEVKRANLSVVYGPLDSHAYKVELLNENWRNVGKILDAGVNFAVMTDHPVVLARNLLLQLRFLLRFGVSKAEALKHICAVPAGILGIPAGVIEKGKWASFACWDGDPFSLSSRIIATFGEGEEIGEGV